MNLNWHNIYLKLWVWLTLILSLHSCKQEENLCYESNCELNEICIDGTCVVFKERKSVVRPEINLEQIRPEKISITKLTLTRFPAKKLDGSDWDENDQPDLHITLYRGATYVWKVSKVLENANFNRTEIELDSAIVLPEFSKNHTFSMYDADSTLTDEFMAGVVFDPYSTNNEYPTELVVDKGGLIAFRLELEYEF